MINLTATTEKNPQTIFSRKIHTSPKGQRYWQLMLVAWVSQSKKNLTSTIKYKWRVRQFLFADYTDKAQTFSVSFGGKTDSIKVTLPKGTPDPYVTEADVTAVRSLGPILHDPATGALTGTFTLKGYQFGGYDSYDSAEYSKGTFEYTESGSVPTISVTPDPEEDEPDPPTPLVFDNDPRYYIYSDGQLIYAAGLDGYDVLNPKLTLEVNKAGSLTFDLPIGSEGYNLIHPMSSTVEVRQGNEILFRGRLLNTSRNMMNTITCYCEGFLAWMNDISLMPYQYAGTARKLLQQYITRYNRRSSSNRKLTYVYSDVSASVSVEVDDYSNVWKEVKNVLIDNMGGYFVPYLTSEITGIQWLSSFGTTTSQVIQFGRNLLDFEEEKDASDVFNAVRALGKEVNGTRVSLSGDEGFVYSQSSIDDYGRIERTVFFDEITKEADLRKVAREYLRTGLYPTQTISMKAADLHMLDTSIERIRLGDAVRSISPPHGIDAFFMCTKMELKLDHPKDNEYTFGSSQRTISSLTDASYRKYVITEGSEE